MFQLFSFSTPIELHMLPLDSENMHGVAAMESVEVIFPEIPDPEAKEGLYGPAFPVSTRAALTSVPRQPDQFSGESRVRESEVPIL